MLRLAIRYGSYDQPISKWIRSDDAATVIEAVDFFNKVMSEQEFANKATATSAMVARVYPTALEADGDHLDFIRSNFNGIPTSAGHHCVWHNEIDIWFILQNAKWLGPKEGP